MLSSIASLNLLRGLQCLPNGLGGAMLATDWLHGQAQPDMVRKMGYPPWFPTVLGIFKLTQLALNWAAGAGGVAVSQLLFALQMGGALYTHTVVEEKPILQGSVPCLAFAGVGVAIQLLNGRVGFELTLIAHTALLAVGFGLGYAVSSLGRAKRPASPVKHSRSRGF